MKVAANGRFRVTLAVLVLAVTTAFAVTALASGRAQASNVPTLGASAAMSGTTGFGAVQPHDIDLGGDSTTIIEGVHWNSWGGSRAVGTGLADWVWPGWCVACGEQTLTATIVAYDLTSCRGREVYEQVEWYFPTRGQTFSPDLSTRNLCSGNENSAANRYFTRWCPNVSLSSGHHAYSLVTASVAGYGRPPGCQLVRSTALGVLAVRHYRHDARWHSGSWWCGSQLSMSTAYPPAQLMECVRGNWETVSFALAMG